MAALTTDQTVPAHKQVSDSALFADYDVAASTVIYKGGFVALDSSGNLVMAVAPVSSVSTTQVGNKFVGIAQEHIASQSAAGDAKCNVQISGYFVYSFSGVSKADVGKPIWLSDDNTLTATAGGGLFVGWIVDADGSNAVVRLPGLGNPGTSQGFITRVSAPIDLVTINTRTLLVHETENHNGIVLCQVDALVTTLTAMDTAAAVVTITHTTATETTMGATLTGADALPANDMIAGAGGQLWRGSTNDAIVPAPADAAIIAKVTTAGTDTGTAAGAARVILVALAL